MMQRKFQILILSFGVWSTHFYGNFPLKKSEFNNLKRGCLSQISAGQYRLIGLHNRSGYLNS